MGVKKKKSWYKKCNIQMDSESDSFTLKRITPPLNEKFSILIKLNDPCVAVTIGYKEVAIGHDSNSTWFAEVVIIIARFKGNSKSEE
jgi:hypothetical protein